MTEISPAARANGADAAYPSPVNVLVNAVPANLPVPLAREPKKDCS